MNKKTEKKRTIAPFRDETERAKMLFATLRKKFDQRGSGALLFAFLLIGLYVTAKVVGTHVGPAQVRFVETNAVPSDDQKHGPTAGSTELIFSGEVYNTAQRLREVGALAMVVSLTSFAEFSETGQFPSSVDRVLVSLRKRKLTPPGVNINRGELESPSCTIKLNYQQSPFLFEIISIPTGRNQGPSLMLRFPLPAGSNNSVTYFRSSSENPNNVPLPFSTIEQIIANGWVTEQWRGDALPINEMTLNDLREQDSLVRSVYQNSK